MSADPRLRHIHGPSITTTTLKVSNLGKGSLSYAVKLKLTAIRVLPSVCFGHRSLIQQTINQVADVVLVVCSIRWIHLVIQLEKLSADRGRILVKNL